MRVAQALTELLTNLAAAADEVAERPDLPSLSSPGQDAEDRADDLLALFIHNREQAGRVMLGLGSFIVYGWAEHADKVEQRKAAKTLATPPEGGPVPHFVEMLNALIDAYEAGEKINEPAIMLAAQIVDNPGDASLVLWVFGVYLVSAAPKDRAGRKTLIDALVASCLRQQFFFDVELEPAPTDHE